VKFLVLVWAHNCRGSSLALSVVTHFLLAHVVCHLVMSVQSERKCEVLFIHLLYVTYSSYVCHTFCAAALHLLIYGYLKLKLKYSYE